MDTPTQHNQPLAALTDSALQQAALQRQMMQQPPKTNAIVASFSAPTSLWPAAAKVISHFGRDFLDFAMTFAPQYQPDFAQNPDKCMSDTEMPTLSVVANAYGRNRLKGWLIGQMEDLNRLAGARDKSQCLALEQTAEAIISEYSHLRITDIMLFLNRFKAGRYGRFYGTTDPLVVTSALPEYCKERTAAMSRIHLMQERVKAKLQTLRWFGEVEMNIEELRHSTLWANMTAEMRHWFETVASLRDNPDGTAALYDFHFVLNPKTNGAALNRAFHAKDYQLYQQATKGL